MEATLQNVGLYVNALLREPPTGVCLTNGMGARRSQAAINLREGFARRLAMARELAGYKTQEDAAKELGIEAERYRRWERAETEPAIDKLVDISHKFRVSLDVLIRGTERDL